MKCRTCSKVIRSTMEKYIQHCLPCWDKTDWSGAKTPWRQGTLYTRDGSDEPIYEKAR